MASGSKNSINKKSIILPNYDNDNFARSPLVVRQGDSRIRLRDSSYDSFRRNIPCELTQRLSLFDICQNVFIISRKNLDFCPDSGFSGFFFHPKPCPFHVGSRNLNKFLYHTMHFDNILIQYFFFKTCYSWNTIF